MIAERAGGWTDEDGLESMKKLEDELQDDTLVEKATTIFSVSEIESAEQWDQAMAVPEMAAELTPLLETFVSGDKLMIPVTLAQMVQQMPLRNGYAIGLRKRLNGIY